MLPWLALFIPAALSRNTNKPQRAASTPACAIKISEEWFCTAAAASVLLRARLRPRSSIYLLLWQTRANYYPGCTRDGSHYSYFLFRLQVAGCPLCNLQNTCAGRFWHWQRRMGKLIFMNRNSFPLIKRTELAACWNSVEDTESTSPMLTLPKKKRLFKWSSSIKFHFEMLPDFTVSVKHLKRNANNYSISSIDSCMDGDTLKTCHQWLPT